MLKISSSDLKDIAFSKATKKPIIIQCAQIHEPFSVDTIEGTMTGKKGDWLMKGIEGELYICDDTIFRKSYNLIEE